MNDLRQAAQQALEALELHGKQYPHMVKGYCLDAITAVREALAQPQQQAEPVHGDIRALKYRIHELEGEVMGYKRMLDVAEAASQPQQQAEPVGSLSVRYYRGCKSMTNTDFDYTGDLPEGDYELYTAPPQRKELSAGEILNMMPSTIPAEYDGELMEFARAVEAKTKEGT